MGRLKTKAEVLVEVGDAVGGTLVRGWAKAPIVPRPSPIAFYCLAGGACTTRYFDLDVPGMRGYSMAEHLAAAGHLVISIDHPGVGQSPTCDDVFALAPTGVASSHASAVAEIRRRLLDGSLSTGLAPIADVRLVGLGHSMGGMLAGVAQARHQCFDALAVLGHGGDGLPNVLQPAEAALSGLPLEQAEGRVIELARIRFRMPAETSSSGLRSGAFLPQHAPPELRAAYVRQQGQLLYSCGLVSMIPGSTDTEKAAVKVPLLLAFGDNDLTSAYLPNLGRYRSVTDAQLFVLADSGHCHNQSDTRAALWNRLISWARAVLP